jgi:hypothetical protein
MLILALGKTCDVCKEDLSSEVVQAVMCQCARCEHATTRCARCKAYRCPDCLGRTLRSSFDWAEANPHVRLMF